MRFTALGEIGTLNPFVSLRRIGFYLIRVAGTDNGRVDKFVGPVRRDEQFGVAQFNINCITRHNVRDIHAENIRSLLFQQRGAFAILFCLIKLLLRHLTLLDLSGNDLIADDHLHAMDRRSGGRGENIAAADGEDAVIGIGLLD